MKHNEKTVMINDRKNSKKFIFRKLKISSSFLRKYKQIIIPLELGDSLAMYTNLIHKSGQNKSNKVFFTVIC